MKWTTTGLRLACVLAIGTGIGCADDGANGTDALVGVEVVAAGADCAAGGIRVNSGADANGNGTLDADEVTSTELVCAGESPAQALISTTQLSAGDANCANGGIQLEVGLDDDGNGTLDAAEVDDTVYQCDIGVPNLFVGDMTEPAGAAGTGVIDASGGNATMGAGGDGEDIEIYFEYGSLGGHLKIFSTGAADASFTTPSATAFLGDNPLMVTADLTPTMVVAMDTSMLTDGEIYQLDGSRRLLRWNATLMSGEVITGVDVASGVTLTLPYHPDGTTNAGLDLENDLHVAGTVTAERAPMSLNGTNIEIDVTLLVLDAGSLIDASGLDGTGTNGGNGGNVDLDADVDETAGTIIAAGTVDTSGGDGLDGGSAGNIALDADGRIYSTGTLTATGGAGAAGVGGGGGGIGGGGGDVTIETDYGPVNNSANIDARGGASALGEGGPGGDVELYTDSIGDVRNSGNIDVRGGDGTGATAGSGGDIEIYAYAGAVYSTGTLDARGGESPTGTGGAGGDIEIWNEYYDPWDTDYAAPGNIEISGDLLAGGGNGQIGGDAGEIDIYLDAEYTPNGQELILYGYATINSSGGDGVTSGGGGGDVDIDQEYASAEFPSAYGPGGAILVYANVDTTGGDASNGSGGSGGDFDADTEEYYGSLVDFEIVRVAGDLDLSGGSGTTGAGSGGDLECFGFNGVEVSGAVTSNGGDVSAADSGAASGGDSELISETGYVTVTGDITFNGGDATGMNGSGGDGGDLQPVLARTITIAGNVDLAGGDATATGGTGGDGGDVEVQSTGAALATVTGTLSAPAGAGATAADAGEDGDIVVDGITQP